ncbi:hypothetical protein LI031_25400 [Enterocloster citroniae]|uniref:hypothetical protein n=1 Tax=Enterocloster citroniae TaxID=358743 RepID=UPI001D073C86|nr:hypothetical protein [Enterocloster citroniae]MCB7067204.1 hypothetical protein [Enterocloster citroniae]
MKLKDLWVRIGNIEISSKDMTKLSLECGKAVIEYDEPNTPEGVSKFSGLYAVQTKLSLYVHMRSVKIIEISQGV